MSGYTSVAVQLIAWKDLAVKWCVLCWMACYSLFSC